jgi:transposase
MSYRTIQNWIAWYRQGGLAEVLLRITGHGSQGVAPFLNERQQRALAAKAELGAFRTVWDAVAWVEARWGIRYTYKGMYALLKRHGFGPKVPRPQSEKANLAQQEQWKKGGW